MTRKVLVTGSRNWTDRQVVADALLAARDDPDLTGDGKMLLVHGACPSGADKIADEYARAWGWDIDPHPADWNTYGKSAGPLRNVQMVALGADVCLAFPLPDSRGTVHCMTMADQAGIPVKVYTVDTEDGQD